MTNRYLRLGAFAVLFFAIATWALTAGGQQPQSYVPRQVIIKLDPTTPTADALAVRSSLRASVKTRFKSSGAELWVIDGIEVTEAIQRFKDDPRVDYIEPNYIVRALDVFPNDPRFDDLWGMHNTGQTGGTPDADIDAPEAWELGTGGTVLVGVIDTGVDYNHVDLAANMFINPNEIAGNGVDDDFNGYIDDVRGWDFVNNDNNPMDDHGHGTHCSGTIGAVGDNGIGVVGVSWSVRIMGLKFLDAGGFGSTENAILAVEYATMMGVNLTSNSWGGGGFSQALQDAIEAAGNAGILFVAAAGNAASNNDVFPNYPSNYPLDNIIAVASTDHNDNLSDFSNFGLTTVDLGAPGTDILSTFPGNSYGTISGTSMATPHVSGAVSLLWAAAPEMTHMEVKNTIMASVDVIPALQGRTVTGGRLNVFNILSGLDDIPPDPIQDLSVQSTGSTTALLAWTATGDDGNVGTARTYDLRYSTSPIDAGNFDLAISAGTLPAPRAVGAPESFEVSGLDYNSTYYFALVVVDEQQNRSGVSNSPNGTTLGAPVLDYTPTSFSSSLLTGGTETQMLTISNTGEGTLDFAFPSSAMQTGAIGGVAPTMMPMWLSANPSSGRVLAGQSMQVELIFDATGLPGGNYSENVTFSTNDHAHESAALDVALYVTGAPDVVASPLEVDFGVRYTGSCTTLEVVFTNRGFMPLVVDALSSNNPVFGVDPEPFVVGAGMSHTIQVTYCPESEEMTPGIPRRYPRRSQAVLTLSSNDPDHPAYTLPMFGDAVAPPVIVVTPTSLSEDLFTGGNATHALSITNDGATNLEFAIAVEDLGSSAVRFGTTGTAPDRREDITPAGTKTAHSGSAYAAGHAGTGRRELTTAEPAITSPNALEILLVHSGDVAEIQNALLAFPDVATVDTYDAGSSTPMLTDLEPYDGVILIANFAYSDPQALGDVLADYVDGGGGVVMTLATFIDGWDVGGRFFSDGYYPFTLGSGPVGIGDLANFNANHPIMAGVSAATGDLLGATTLAPGAEWVADWSIGQPFIATQGDHVVGANVFIADGGFWSGDVALILHNSILWAAGAAWLTAEPTEGVVPPGSTLDVAVTFDAAGLFGGDYSANLRIGSNDPVTPEVVVPADLHVTGAPDLELSDALLAYGQVFIGGTSNKTVVVTNAGTDVLNITSIVASHPSYSADAASMVLAPGTSQNLIVSFAPTATGAADGTLTFTSDDPDEPSLVVDLTGEGILPPIISVTPLSFEADLFTGETSTQTMTISNSGASNLEFEIDVAEVEAMGASVKQSISIPRSTGDFPRGTHASSVRAAPSSASASSQSARSASAVGPMAAIGSAFATEISFGQATRFGLGTPEVLNFVGAVPAWIWAGDFGGEDYAYAYAVDEFNQFMQIDTTSGAQTILGTITPFGGEIWTGMAFDPTDGLMYATSTDVFASSFYVIDVTVPSATRIGSVEMPGLIALAIDDEGAAWSYDIVTDELVSIDKTTGLGTPVGSLGFDANFGQGMAFDAESGQLYLAAFNNSMFQAELRIADRTTGATALVGVLGATEPGDLVQLGFLALPGLGGVRWLIADPDAGVVPPGTSMDVAITFDAEGLYGGDYNANLVVANNDPLNPEVVASAHLHVTGAPDIQVTPLALDYGPVFIGGVSNQIVVIKNVGTDLLTVTSISSDHGDYTADVPNVVLAPTASQAVVVSYAPTSTGLSAATLTIASDDPDEASIAVAMTGEGRLPPIISVNPTSFTEDLFTGETAAHTLTISNTGASDLEFAIDIEDLTVGAAASRAVLLRGRPWLDRTLRGGGAVGVNVEGADSRTSQTRTAIQPTTKAVAAEDAAILVIQDTDAWGIDMASFIFDNFAISATVINSNQIATTDFEPFDLVITVGDEFFSYYNEISSNVAKFEDYVAGGGVVQYQLATQGDNVSIVGGVSVIYGNGETFNDVLEPSHPIVAGLPLVLEGNAANHTYLSGLPGDAVLITETSSSGDPTTVEYEFGLGNVVATGMTWEFLYNFGYEAGAMLGNAVAYSLSLAGVKWISVDPSDGVVPPGNSMDVSVLFNAEGLYGGDYLANLLVSNNDPLNPIVTVPASLHVTGAPDITVEDTLLDFGPVFVGGNKQKTVVVANDGTDMLNVSSIVSSHPDYSVSISAFSLAPEGSQDVVVTYAPTSVAPSAGTLTITSDDPDEGVIVIAMQGEGLEPPVISVTPLSFEADLFTGETSTQTMTISNSGGNNLEFDISVDEIDALNASVTKSLNIPRSSGDFPRGTHAPSVRAAPTSQSSRGSGGQSPLAALGSAFATEIGFGQATRFSLGTPEELNFVGPVPAWIWAGDFGGEDYAYAYAVDEFNQFMQMDTTSGAQTILGTIAPFGFEVWTGMAFDPTDGLMYATSTDVFASSFYVIDVTVPSATRIGSVNSPGIIALAIDDDGAAWAYDIVTDELVSVDKTTGAGTPVGSLGFDANFGQGMAFDAESGQLYLAAFNNFSFQAELRVADRTTGATALVGVLGANDPGGTVQLGFLALPGLGGARWLMADPNSGVVPPGTSMDVAVTFDAAGLYGGDYNANLVVANNDPLNPEVVASAHLHVTGAPDIAVTPLALDYGQVFIGAVSNQVVEIKNAGTDVLTVSSIVTTHPDYTTSAANAVIAPGTSQAIIVSYAPTATGVNNATLTITSDDPDEAIIDVSLTGEGLEPPVISVTPLSMSEDLFTGESASHTLTIDNSAGGSALIWSASTAFPDNTSSVVESSASFGDGKVSDLKKDPQRNASAARPDRDAVFAFGARGSTKVPASVMTPLEDILANLEENFASVNSLIPNRFDFTEGEVGNNISDGGNDMYDGGNMLGTDLGGPIDYSNGVVASSPVFGTDGRYFTRKYPGLFVMVADMTGVEYFEIFGNLGADGFGNVDGAILSAEVSGSSFQGFVKRVYNAFDPSVNQLILVEESPTASHEFAINTDDNYHRAFGLSDSRRVYYVLYASENGGYVDDTATLAIMEAFLNALGLAPGWVSIEPNAGSVPAGASVDVQVTFDASGLIGGDYDANILVANNDPLNPEVVVTTHLHVTGAPDVAATPSALDFGQLFIGASAQQLVEVSNVGTDVLTVSSISANHPDYSVDVANAVLPPGGSVIVTVTYAPTSAAVHNAVLTIASDDPDEASLPVTLTGEGLVPPVIAVTPTSISEDVFSGAVVHRMLNIDNSGGGSNLFWNATVASVTNTSSLVATSPAFGTGVATAQKKETAKPKASAAQPDPSATYTFPARAVAEEPAAVSTPIETVLENLNLNYAAVTSMIPNRFDFTEGEAGNNIIDGNNDMYDGGNFLATTFMGGIAYSNDTIIPSAAFGPDGRYFTRKYPGLWVLVADMSEIDYFQIYGNLGADGSGFADGAVLSAEVSGVSFQGFVKRVYDAFDPSVNHLIIVEENPAASHSFATFTDDDYHAAFGLSSSRRIYYLLYAAENGGYIDNVATMGIMEAFLNSIGLSPQWISMAPTSGTVPAGMNANIEVTLDAAGLMGGDYDANILVASNDPVTPEVTVPVHMHVTGAPDIEVSPAFVNFGPVYVGATAFAPMVVTNNGTDVLDVSNIVAGLPQFGTDLTSFSLAPGANQTVMVSFSPSALGILFGPLTITSNDPDEGSLGVFGVGEGVEPPIISLSAASLSDDLSEGETNTQVLTVSNVGANTLNFNVAIAGQAGGSEGGGPDFFGYRWRDSNEPDGPVFDWVDASGGTDLVVGDDGFVTGIPLGFTFHYYGLQFTTVGVGADGWLSFNGSNNGYPETVPQNDIYYAGAIAPYARDLAVSGANYVRYQTVGSPPNRRFVVEYNQIPDQGGGNAKTFEVIFSEGSNAIHFQYLVASNAPAGLGIESPNGEAGMGDGGLGEFYIDPSLVVSNYALEFIGRPSWLSVSPIGGSVIAGSGVDVFVTFDATGLPNGDFAAELIVTSDDPLTPSITVPVTLTVTGSQISGIDADAVPTEFGLHDNKPNPFNPTTTIAYDLPHSVEVTLVVYDVHGRVVRELVNAKQPAGRHSFVWDGRNGSSNQVASGVYFYRLTAGSFVRTKKMVLLK